MAESESNRSLLWLLIVLGVAILLAVTNPSEESHRKQLSAEYSQARPLAGAVGLGALGAQMPQYHSLVFASYTAVGDEITSIGVLGVVRGVDVELKQQ